MKCKDIKEEKKSFLQCYIKHRCICQGSWKTIFKLRLMNFVFQMYRQRLWNRISHMTSKIYRQQDIKLEKLKKCIECNSPAFSPPLLSNGSFNHFQMVLPLLYKHKGGKFSRNDAKNTQFLKFQGFLKNNCSQALKPRICVLIAQLL